MLDLWHLQLTSWEGIAFGARHHYATLKCNDQRINCLRELGAEEVAHLNGEDGDGKFHWQVGMEVGNFDSKDDAIAASLVVWSEVGETDDLLLRGNSAQSFNEPLSGPQNVVSAIVDLRDRYKRVCGVDEQGEPLGEPSWEAVKDLYVEWDAILKPFRADTYKLYVTEKSFVIKLDGTVVDRDAKEIEVQI